MNDSLKKWLLYCLGGLLPVWLADTVFLPRLDLGVAPVLLPICVVAVAVLEGAFPGAQFGLVTGLLWALTYAGAAPGRIPLLTFLGMLSGAVSQYALRRSLSGCLVCAAGAMALLGGLNMLRGLVTGLAPFGPLLLLVLEESVITLLCTPLLYFLFYKLYRKAGGKPA